MTRLCKYVDVCIGNEEDAETTLVSNSSNLSQKWQDLSNLYII